MRLRLAPFPSLRRPATNPARPRRSRDVARRRCQWCCQGACVRERLVERHVGARCVLAFPCCPVERVDQRLLEAAFESIDALFGGQVADASQVGDGTTQPGSATRVGPATEVVPLCRIPSGRACCQPRRRSFYQRCYQTERTEENRKSPGAPSFARRARSKRTMFVANRTQEVVGSSPTSSTLRKPLETAAFYFSMESGN